MNLKGIVGFGSQFTEASCWFSVLEMTSWALANPPEAYIETSRLIFAYSGEPPLLATSGLIFHSPRCIFGQTALIQ